LPWFINYSCEWLLRRVARRALAIQIETKENHDLSFPLQYLTNQEPINVRTGLIAGKK